MSDREFDPFIEQIAAELRRPVQVDAQFDDRVMAAIEEPEVIPLRPMAPRPWIKRPWTISVSPVSAIAAAAAFIGLLGLGVWRVNVPSSQVAADPDGIIGAEPVADATPLPDNSPQMHQFIFVAPKAQSLSLVGDFNDWDASATPMTRISDDGVWSVTLPLAPGQYQFQYLMNDTTWIADPTLPKVADPYGSVNSLVTIAPRSRQ